MLYLSKRCQFFLPVILAGDMGFVRLDEQTLRTALADPIHGGAYRDRTDDPLLAKQMLSQLS